MKYYDIHIDDSVSSFSLFIEIKEVLLPPNPEKQDIVGYAVDVGDLDPDDIKYVDNVTEISEEEYKKATRG